MVALSIAGSLEKHEAVIASGLRSFVEVGSSLAAIRDGRLYKERGFENFEAYCKERWNFNRSNADRIIATSEVAAQIDHNCGESRPTSEAHVRPLLKLPAEKRADAWKEAVAKAAKAPKGRVTAKHVAEVVAERMPSKKPAAAVKPAQVPIKDEVRPPKELLADLSGAIADTLAFWPSNESLVPAIKLLEEKLKHFKTMANMRRAG